MICIEKKQLKAHRQYAARDIFPELAYYGMWSFERLMNLHDPVHSR